MFRRLPGGSEFETAGLCLIGVDIAAVDAVRKVFRRDVVLRVGIERRRVNHHRAVIEAGTDLKVIRRLRLQIRVPVKGSLTAHRGREIALLKDRGTEPLRPGRAEREVIDSLPDETGIKDRAAVVARPRVTGGPIIHIHILSIDRSARHCDAGVTVFRRRRGIHFGIHPRVADTVIRGEIPGELRLHGGENCVDGLLPFIHAVRRVIHVGRHAGAEGLLHHHVNAGIRGKLILRVFVARDQEIARSELPIHLDRGAEGLHAVIRRVVHRHPLAHMVQHFLVVLLPVAVPADAGEVLREVLPFSEKPHLVAAPLRHINREGVR